MDIVERLSQQHTELISLCKQLKECSVEKYISKDAAFIHGIQQKLHEILRLHLQLEDMALYPFLLENKDEKIRAAVLKIQEEVVQCSSGYKDFQEKYPTKESIESHAAAYIEDAAILTEILSKRIEKEESELYILFR